MDYRNLGQTDLRASVVGMGCWAIVGGFNWGVQDERDSLAALRAAYEAGINFFDTAELYGQGASESLIRKALGDVRSHILIASKAASTHFLPHDLRAACEGSLQRLGTDCIDLYQLHWPSREFPIAETVATLEALRDEGKIRWYGVSNFGCRDLAECAAAGGRPVSNQLAYNLLFRAIEYEIQPACQAMGAAILPYCPILQGLLAGKFSSADDVPSDRARTRHFAGTRPAARHGQPGAELETFAAVAAVRHVAAELGVDMAHLAIAWLIAQPGIGPVLVGARTAHQALHNAAAANLQLDPATRQRLDRATDRLKTMLGPNPDMWQVPPRIA